MNKARSTYICRLTLLQMTLFAVCGCVSARNIDDSPRFELAESIEAIATEYPETVPTTEPPECDSGKKTIWDDVKRRWECRETNSLAVVILPTGAASRTWLVPRFFYAKVLGLNWRTNVRVLNLNRASTRVSFTEFDGEGRLLLNEFTFSTNLSVGQMRLLVGKSPVPINERFLPRQNNGYLLVHSTRPVLVSAIIFHARTGSSSIETIPINCGDLVEATVFEHICQFVP